MPAKKNAKPAPAVVLPNPATPTVSLNLTEFFPISSGTFCKLGNASPLNPIAQMTAIGGAQSIGLYNGGVGGGAPHGGLKVKTTALITFSIAITPVPGLPALQGPYNIAGLTLEPLTGAATDRNFSRSRWTPTWLQFLVAFGNRGGRWKLYISVLDYSNGAPVLGIIDPEIENDVPALERRSP